MARRRCGATGTAVSWADVPGHEPNGEAFSVAGTSPGPATASRLGGQIARAIVALGVRQGVVKLVTVIGTVILARILDPATFGAYAVVSFVVALFTLVGDMGLAATLIQQDREPTDHELAVVFTTQQIVLATAAVVVTLASDTLASTFHLADDAGLVIRILAVGLVISSLRTIPSTLLERRIQFTKLAVAEGSQVIVYQGVAIAMAASGHGVVSFALAAASATAVNTLLVNVIQPWRPRWQLDTAVLRRMLAFGLPYQASAAVSFLKDAVNPLFIGLVIGVAAVGQINWAVMVIGYPLLIVSILNRLYFPAFARLREHRDALRRFASAVIRWNVFAVVGMMLPFLVSAEVWTRIVFGPQWVPAVPLVYWLAVTMPFAAAAAPGLALLAAFGRSRDILGFTVMWMVATWVATVPAVAAFGWIGFGVANALVLLTTPLFMARIQAFIDVPIWKSIATALLAAGVGASAGVMIRLTIGGTSDATAAILSALGTAVAYVIVWIALSRRELLADLITVRKLGKPTRA